jgi:SAM-dependent methyltransferase
VLPPGMDRNRLRQIAPRALRDVLMPCMDDRKALVAGMQAIPRLTAIADDTSRKVEQQYIADPYPRWLSLQTPQSGIARASLGDFFTPDALAFMDRPYNVLIAGCGTGQQAVSAALGYGPDADVLAVDLSTSSLAYAARMAERYDAGNLRFAQADILGLGALDRTFDIIECVGVLHHMANPYDAWRILIDRLRPGGLILTGLYSAISRGNFSALREDPDWPGTDADDSALRTYRRALMTREAGLPGTELLVSKDFYAKSGFRDLALHVSEQYCSLPDIKAFLDANRLVFSGFHLPPHLLDGFRQAYPDAGWPGSLDHWQAFEEDHPRTFDGMYNFWCRKV